MLTANLSALELQQRTIALESNILSNALSAVTTRLPTYVTEINVFIRSLFDLSEAPPLQLVGNRKAQALVKGMAYPTLLTTTVYTPPGLSVPYMELVDVLASSERIASVILKDTLQPFNKWLAVQLSNPDRLVTISGAHIPGFTDHDIPRVIRTLGDCFKASPAQVETHFGNAFKRLADFATVAQELNRINDSAAHVTPKMMLAQITELTTNLDLLIKRMSEDPETYRTSSAVVRSLADTALIVARECEFYSVFHYQLKSTLQAFLDTEAHLEKSIPTIAPV